MCPPLSFEWPESATNNVAAVAVKLSIEFQEMHLKTVAISRIDSPCSFSTVSVTLSSQVSCLISHYLSFFLPEWDKAYFTAHLLNFKKCPG